MDTQCPRPLGDGLPAQASGQDNSTPFPPETLPPPVSVASSATPSPAPGPEAREPPHGAGRGEFRRLIESLILLLAIILVLRTIAIEPYGVPTGSMAPALVGNHKAVDCPRCGFHVVVGHRGDSGDTQTSRRSYAAAVCPNCNFGSLGLDKVPESAGDRLMVDKNVFEVRTPRRWEMAVFRCPVDLSKPFVKRVVGLPGEGIMVREGDVYIDRTLARKSLEETRAMCILVFDNNHQPVGPGWLPRWVAEPARSTPFREGTGLRIAASQATDYQWLIYRHWMIDREEEVPITDTNGYNGAEAERRLDAVHDFIMECDLEVVGGTGTVALGISDGHDDLVVELPLTKDAGGARLGDAHGLIRTAPKFHLSAGAVYHVELAFVDRRLTLVVDGHHPFEPVDLDPMTGRSAVRRPARIGAKGAEAVVRNFRLFRDIHYTESGQHAVRTPYRLGADEYFVLGDNSPNSDDSRFWATPAVPGRNFLGKPFLVHMPSRFARWDGFGQRWEHQGPDWGRVRLLD